jgi:chromate transporter
MSRHQDEKRRELRLALTPEPVSPVGHDPRFPLSPAPSPWLILRVWLLLGAQSFGGGAVTLTLIRQAVVDRYGWISEAEFTRDLALCHITPGINLVALAVLIGRRLAGAQGIVLAALGLLLPSVTMTVLITAFFARVHHLEGVQAAMRGVVPATVGLGLLTAQQMARPLLAVSRREGRTSLLLSLVLLVGAGLAAVLANVPVLFILCGSGVVGAVVHYGRQAARAKKDGVKR